jgi:hypothetical protein
MKIVFYLVAAVLGFLGLMFVAGSQGQIVRIIIGIVLFIAAGGLVYLSRIQPQIVQTNITQKIDLSGDVSVESLKCKSCGAPLTEKSVSVQAGAVMVNCEYCGSVYQLEEEVKW